MQELISPFPARVASLTGHVITFEANVPRDVPEMLVRECMAAGCIPTATVAALKDAAPKAAAKPAAAKPATTFAKPPAPTRERPEDAVVEKDLDELLTTLAKSGDASFLSTKGKPKAIPLCEELGYTVTAKEASASWDRIAVSVVS